MGHNPAGPKSLCICLSLFLAFFLTLQQPSLTRPFELLLICHFSLFVAGVIFLWSSCEAPVFPLYQTLLSLLPQRLKVGRSPPVEGSVLFVCHAVFRLRGCSNFVVVLKLQTWADLPEIPGELRIRHGQATFALRPRKHRGKMVHFSETIASRAAQLIQMLSEIAIRPNHRKLQYFDEAKSF